MEPLKGRIISSKYLHDFEEAELVVRVPKGPATLDELSWPVELRFPKIEARVEALRKHAKDLMHRADALEAFALSSKDAHL